MHKLGRKKVIKCFLVILSDLLLLNFKTCYKFEKLRDRAYQFQSGCFDPNI